MSNPYLYKKMVQAHHQELLYEAKQQRMAAQMPRHHTHLMWNIARRLAAFLVSLLFSANKVVPLARKFTS